MHKTKKIQSGVYEFRGYTIRRYPEHKPAQSCKHWNIFLGDNPKPLDKAYSLQAACFRIKNRIDRDTDTKNTLGLGKLCCLSVDGGELVPHHRLLATQRGDQ